MCLFMHLFLIIVTLCNYFLPKRFLTICNVITILAASLYIALYYYIIADITKNFSLYTRHIDTKGNIVEVPIETSEAIVWYLIEAFMLVANIFAYVVYIFVRSFSKVYFHLVKPGQCFDPNSDFVEYE